MEKHPCEITGCRADAESKGLCHKHYMRAHRGGGSSGLNETEFVLMRDMRANGFSVVDVTFELMLSERDVWLAWRFDTFKGYKNGVEELAHLWRERRYQPWRARVK